MSAPPLSLNPKAGSRSTNTKRPATANWPADMIPAMITWGPAMPQILAGAGNRSPSKSEAAMTLMSKPGNAVQIANVRSGKFALAKQDIAPVLLGEFGACNSTNADFAPTAQNKCSAATDAGYLDHIAEYLGENGFSWFYWAINGTSARNASVDQSGQPIRPYGSREGYGIVASDWTRVNEPADGAGVTPTLQMINTPSRRHPLPPAH